MMLLAAILLPVVCGCAQIPLTTVDATGWIRIHSDDGKLSIEMPETVKRFYDKKGFWITEYDTGNNFELQEMNMFNAYLDGAVVSIESYKAPKGAVKAFSKNEARNSADSEIDRGNYKIYQYVNESVASRMMRQYLYSGSHVYVITAGSRDRDNVVVRRFLESLRFEPERKNGPHQSEVTFSKIPVARVDTPQDADYKPPVSNSTTQPPKDDRVIPVMILSKPKASYVDSARRGNVQGNVRFKITLAADGFIPKVQLLGKGLSGLTRQAFFSAMRIKFLPKLEDKKPVDLTVTFDYGFNIY